MLRAGEVGDSGDGYGTAVGDYFEIIADVEATEAEAPELAASMVVWLTRKGNIAAEPADCVLGAESGYPPGPHYTAAVIEPDEVLLQLRANGVEVSANRTVFSPAQGTVGSVACPLCGQTLDLNDPATGQLTPHWELSPTHSVRGWKVARVRCAARDAAR